MARPNHGPRLEIGGGGNYEIRWTEGGRSKRRSTGTANLREAQREFALFLSEAERAARPDGLTVNEILDAYEERHVAPKVASKRTSKQCIQNLRPYFGELIAADIKPQHVEQYTERRKAGRIGFVDEQGKSHGYRKAVDATIRRELVVLVSAMNFAAKKQLMPKGSIPAIELPPASLPRERWLTEQEAARLAAAAQPPRHDRLTRAYRFIVLALNTAARAGALEELKWFQVDWDNRLIRLNPEGRRQTKKRRATVPMSDELFAMMQRAYAEKNSEFVLDHARPIRTYFETAARRARLDGVTPHILRHTWATWAAMAGVSLYEIAGVLGDTIATTERTYLKYCPQHLRSAVNFRSAKVCL